MTSTSRWIVTATPPTPNGDLHIGHLSGPYLAADIIARRLRVAGSDVVAATGVDDHQSYTHLRALRDGVPVPETATFFGDRIVEAWTRFDLEYDVIGRPDRDSEHARLTSEVFARLLAKGDIVVRERMLPYCISCDLWAFEASRQDAARTVDSHPRETRARSADDPTTVPTCPIHGAPCATRRVSFVPANGTTCDSTSTSRHFSTTGRGCRCQVTWRRCAAG